MQTDLHGPLQDIRKHSRNSLACSIADFEEKNRFADNGKSDEFMRTLKCFVPMLASRQSQAQNQKVLREASSRFGYVAISYPWEHSEGEDSTKGGYSVMPGRKPALVRDVVLDRSIRLIHYMFRNESRMLPLWIDQLSINQGDRTERSTAVQSMDLVYKHCKFAIGYIWTEIQNMHQLDLLVDLLKGRILSKECDSRWATLAKHLDPTTAQNVLAVLLLITRDRWWERAWIFQEDHLAGLSMWLLIRHSNKIDKRGFEDTLESIPGEIAFRSATFKLFATLFCLAYLHKTNNVGVRKGCDEVLRKAGKYNILHRYDHFFRPTTTQNILEDLTARKISNSSDILAIVANACQYDRRIEMKGLPHSYHSLSLAILGLLAVNGELLRNDRELPGKLCRNVLEFLKHQVLEIDRPVNNNVLTFKKHCRHSVSHLSRTGIHTKGLLWELWKTIDSSILRRMTLSAEIENDDDYHSALYKFADFLGQEGHWTLVSDIEGYIKAGRGSRLPYDESYDEWPSSWCKDVMAAYVVRAIKRGQHIRLGRLHSRSYSPYRAIFVCDGNNWPPQKSLVYTSWDRTENRNYAGKRKHTLAKYVSLGVELDGETGTGVPKLRTRNWVNGLCFFDSERMSEYVFPWPESLFS